MAKPILLFRIDVGFDPDRGYGAAVLDVLNQRMKGVKGNSIQQITSRLRNVLNEEMAKRKQFPLEHERTPDEPSRIITPGNGF
jgi:hypothetical protein